MNLGCRDIGRKAVEGCQKKHKKVLQRTLLPKSNQKNNQKVCFGKFLDVPKWLRDRAVAEFRIATVHDCLSKPVNALGIAQSPLCKLCDFNEKWTRHSFFTLQYTQLSIHVEQILGVEGFEDGPRNFEPWSSDVDAPELAPPPNFTTTPTGRRLSSR
ncbi:hypothetical protein TNCV_4653271 [Trichonephila clavipes]|nr:hypothetical protein TNCV_4653271 [Trichonephila clavipes]